MVDPSGIYGIEGPSEICTQSAEVRLAVSGAQPLFTLGLHLNYTYKIFKKFHVGLKFEWGL